ncbi:MAG: carotenoid biosynthesis protein [Acidobacteriota bacterium]
MNYRNAFLIRAGSKALVRTGAALTLILGAMFPVGTLGMALQAIPKEYFPATSVYLGVEAALTFALVWASTTPARALLITILLFFLATALEFFGLATGIPFGTYYYAYTLEPFVISNVPLAIVFAWYILVVNIVLLSRPSCGQAGNQRSAPDTMLTSMAGGVMILGIDIMLEPFASFVNHYWTWAGGVIPPENYASWFASGTLLIALTETVLRIPSGRGDRTAGRPEDGPAVHSALSGAPQARPAALLPELVIGLTLVQCAVINVLNGYWLATAAGLLLCGAGYWRIRHAQV